jgi:hypothetical protein
MTAATPTVTLSIDAGVPYVPLMRALVEAAHAVGCTLDQDRRGGLRIVRMDPQAARAPTNGTRIVAAGGAA